MSGFPTQLMVDVLRAMHAHIKREGPKAAKAVHDVLIATMDRKQQATEGQSQAEFGTAITGKK